MIPQTRIPNTHTWSRTMYMCMDRFDKYVDYFSHNADHDQLCAAAQSSSWSQLYEMM